MANGNSNSTPGGDRRTWIATIAVALVLLIAVGAYVEFRPHRIRVSVVKPLRQNISSDITTNGKVEPIHGFEAHAPLAGTVQQVLVKEGQCEFFLLRYVPDAVKDEFVNLGVVLYEPGKAGSAQAGFADVRFTRDWRRV